MKDLADQAWALYEKLDALRVEEARLCAIHPASSPKRLVKLARVCKRAYARFEQRCMKYK